MTWTTILIVCGAVAGGVVAATWNIDPVTLRKFYEDEMRRTLFASFLTLAGFLLSVKTFVVVKVKELLYDTVGYQRQFKVRRELTGTATYYDTLRNFSQLLFTAILMCFLTAIAQYAIGLIPRWWTAPACLALAAATLAMLVSALLMTWRNLRDMFAEQERAKMKELGLDDSPQEPHLLP